MSRCSRDSPDSSPDPLPDAIRVSNEAQLAFLPIVAAILESDAVSVALVNVLELLRID